MLPFFNFSSPLKIKARLVFPTPLLPVIAVMLFSLTKIFTSFNICFLFFSSDTFSARIAILSVGDGVEFPLKCVHGYLLY